MSSSSGSLFCIVHPDPFTLHPGTQNFTWHPTESLSAILPYHSHAISMCWYSGHISVNQYSRRTSFAYFVISHHLHRFQSQHYNLKFTVYPKSSTFTIVTFWNHKHSQFTPCCPFITPVSCCCATFSCEFAPIFPPSLRNQFAVYIPFRIELCTMYFIADFEASFSG